MPTHKKTNSKGFESMKPGVYLGLSFQAYLEIPAINKSSLDYLAQSPAHFYAACLDPKRPPKKETDAMALGTAIHTAILEPQRFKKSYVTEPKNAPRRPSVSQINAKNPSPETLVSIDFWARFNKRNAAKTVISADDLATVKRLAKRVRNHPAAQVLLESGDAEVTLVWIDEETGIACKARLDWKTSGAILDFKSTLDASPQAFAKQVANMEWDVQAGFYTDGFKALFGEEPAFIFGALEKDGPSDKYYSASAEMIEVGRAIYKKRLKLYAECKKKKKWPGYSDEIEDIKPTPWRLKEVEPKTEDVE